jgi:hypothetical protein
MGSRSDPNRIWKLVNEQHGVISREQLIAAGLSPKAIRHRIRTGRLHLIHRGVFAAGRPRIADEGRWLAAVLACGPGAALSFGSAASLWRIEREGSCTEVSVPRMRRVRIPGITVHRPTHFHPGEVRVRESIPVTDPVRTLVDLAATLPAGRVERAVNEADRLDLVHPERLRASLVGQPDTRGVTALREILDIETFTLTDSELEQRFLAIVASAGLPLPVTGARINGFKVDFHWPELGLVVETDGLRYHRTASQQARDRRRDHAHAKAGLETLRFTNRQVRYEQAAVAETLGRVAERLRLARLGVTWRPHGGPK